MKLSSLLLALASLLAPVAFAQDQRPIIITGTLLPRSLGSEIAATSILTREDLERSGARDLVSALNLLGTALVEQQGGPGTAAVVRLRGADSRDTLVLIDGVPLTDVTSGLASLSQLDTNAIERVEVVRGNLSALYGANATGGVIHVFTRRGSAQPQFQATAGAGSRATRAFNASVAGSLQSLSGRFTAGIERSDGFSAANPALATTANPDADASRRRNAALALDWAVAAGHQVGLDLRVSSGRFAYDDPSSFSAPTDTHDGYVLQRGLALRGAHRVSDEWSLAWRAADGYEGRSDTSVSAFGPFTFGNVLRNRMLGVDANGRLADGWNLLLGAERLAQSTENLTYTRQRRDTDVLRLGLQRDAAWGSLQANLRRDSTSDFGGADSALLGGTWRFAPGLSAIASLSTSFTPPTLDFLYFDCAPFGFACSNPDLKPERSRNADLALQWADAATLIRATAFVARYRDKIANDANFIPQNAARVKNQGLELAARTRAGAWSLAGEATLQDIVDSDTGERQLRRPRQQLAARVFHDAGAIGVGAALRYVGDRPDRNSLLLPSYTVVDLHARWRVASRWQVSAALDNVLDRSYQPTAGYNGKPRGVFLSVGWTPQP